MADFRIDDAAIREAVQKAILESIGADQRALLIEGALRHLLTPKEANGYGSRTSPLQDAFNAAVREYAADVIRGQMAGDGPMKSAVDALITDAVTKFAEQNREAVAVKLADAIAKALTGRDY